MSQSSLIVIVPFLLAACAHDPSANGVSGDKSKHCAQLRQKIDDLKGRPQMRKAASDRYQLECVGY